MQMCEIKVGQILFALLLSASVIFIAATKDPFIFPNYDQTHDVQKTVEDFENLLYPKKRDSFEGHPDERHLDVSNTRATWRIYLDDQLPELIKYRLPSDSTPYNYNISLTLNQNPNKFLINGESNITIIIHNQTNVIHLHYVGTISKVILYRDLYFNFIPIEPFFKTFINDYAGILDINFETSLSPGIYHLYIKYINYSLKDSNFFTIPYYIDNISNIDWLITTTFQPIGARHLFPCWDEPEMKATFRISIKHHQNCIVYSNTAIEMASIKDEIMLTSFQRTPKMSTYHIAITVIPTKLLVTHILHTNNTLRYREHINLQHMSKFTDIVTQKLSSYMDSKMGFKTLNLHQIVIPAIQKESIANWGVIVYREDAIIYDRELDPIAQMLEVKRLVTRTLVNAWFGNYAISPSWWTYLWLYEGFAIFFQTKISPERQMKELFVVQTRHESLHTDVRSDMLPLENDEFSKYVFLFPSCLYIKAPVILYMLENIITPEVFQNGIRRFLQQYMLQHATSDALWNEMQIVLNNSNVEHDYILKNVMHTWVKQQNYPIVKVERNHSEVSICLQHFNKSENYDFSTNETWWIPITFTTQSTLNFSNTVPHIWLTPQYLCTTCPIHKNDWIIVNMQQTGYYRVKYERWNWRLIADYLNSKEYMKIHVLNRAQIIDDAYHLMMAKQLDYDIFLKLTSYLSQETDYIAWYPMLKIFEYLSPFLPFQESTPLKDHMLKIVNAVLAKIKYEEYEDDDELTKYLRQEIAKWACILDDFDCKSIANTKLTIHLKDPKLQKLLPGWKEWTYCNGLNKASRITWLKFWSLYKPTSNNNILHVFLCSGGLTSSNFQYNISTNLTMQQYECTNILYYVVMTNAKGLDTTLANLEDHIYYCMFNQSRNIIKVLTVIINHLYSEHQLSKVIKFIGKHLKESAGIIQHVINSRQKHIKYYNTIFSELLNRKTFIKIPLNHGE